jgi:hypothetical protein
MRFRMLISAALVLVAATAHADVKLERKFIEGSNRAIKQQGTFKQKLTIAGMDVESIANNSATTRYKVGKRDVGGVLPVEVKTEALQINLSLPGGINLTFDSANADAKPDNSPIDFLYDVFRAMVGSSVTYQLDKNNVVSFVQGTEETIAKAQGQAAEMLKTGARSRNSQADLPTTDRPFPERTNQGRADLAARYRAQRRRRANADVRPRAAVRGSGGARRQEVGQDRRRLQVGHL